MAHPDYVSRNLHVSQPPMPWLRMSWLGLSSGSLTVSFVEIPSPRHRMNHSTKRYTTLSSTVSPPCTTHFAVRHPPMKPLLSRQRSSRIFIFFSSLRRLVRSSNGCNPWQRHGGLGQQTASVSSSQDQAGGRHDRQPSGIPFGIHTPFTALPLRFAFRQCSSRVYKKSHRRINYGVAPSTYVPVP